MKLLIDHQLPIQLARHLRSKGVITEHVQDCALDGADDRTVWEYVARGGFIVVSKDEDFVFLAARPDDRGRLIWVRLGNCRNAALLKTFDEVWDQLVQAFGSGQRIVELR